MSTMLKEQMTEVASPGLRHRTPGKPSSRQRLTEEVLVEKLDVFLSSIESRLHNFDQFFQFKRNELGIKSALDIDSHHDDKYRRSLTSSLRTFLLKHLNTVHERLHVLKLLVLRHSISNLDYLYLSIEDQYNYLFNTSLEDHQTLAETKDAELGHTHTEVLMEKIIQALQFFDQKLLQIDTLINDNKPAATADFKELSTFKNLRFFNFNRALKAAKSRNLHYYELPLLWRENKYIIQGYRFLLSHNFLCKLVFTIHNETMNIWSHVVGLGVISGLALWHFPQTTVYARSSMWDCGAVYLFLAAACECLCSLIVWHAYLGCAHYKTRSQCASVDYTGITMLITCSVISTEYVTLHNHPRLLTVYIVFLVLCGMIGMVFNWIPYFDRPECRYLRIGFFVGLAFLGATSILCMLFYEGFAAAFGFFLPLMYQSIVFYSGGVVFYGGLFPERWRSDVTIPGDECPHLSQLEQHSKARDVIYDEVEKSGMHEMEQIESEIMESPSPSFSDILKHHFPEKPQVTSHALKFMSLWWVDYCFSSHNIWHICVVLGVVGHYATILQALERILK